MSDNIDLENLAHLARIDIDSGQQEALKESIADILDYVSDVQDITDDTTDTPAVGPVHNVLREDEDPHEPGAYSQALKDQAPATDHDGYIVVPPIL